MFAAYIIYFTMILKINYFCIFTKYISFWFPELAESADSECRASGV